MKVKDAFYDELFMPVLIINRRVKNCYDNSRTKEFEHVRAWPTWPGNLISGDELVEKAIKRGRVAWSLLCQDVSDATSARYQDWSRAIMFH